jgi:ethanolamine utilization protein EutN
MYLGEVIGTCVADRKYDGLAGVKLLVVQPLDRQRKPKGRVEVACDTVQAGVGDFVYLVGSREAALALEETFVPVDSAIVGIVDQLDQPSTPAPSTRPARKSAPPKRPSSRRPPARGTK